MYNSRVSGVIIGSLLLIGLTAVLVFTLRFGEVLDCRSTPANHLDCQRRQLRMFWTDTLNYSDIDPATLTICVHPNQIGSMEQLCAGPPIARRVLLSLPDRDVSYVVEIEDHLRKIAVAPGTAFQFKRSERRHAQIFITILCVIGSVFAWDVFIRKRPDQGKGVWGSKPRG